VEHKQHSGSDHSGMSDHGQMSHDQMMGGMDHGSGGVHWAHFANIMLGAWLLTSPAILGYMNFGLEDLDLARLAAERDLPSVEARNLAMTLSDMLSGVLVMLFGALSLSRRSAWWAQWANAVVGFWLLMAPLIFWAPAPGAYTNDSLIGALVIAFAVLVPMMPGMSMQGMMQPGEVPPNWSYSPSTWLQRMPMAVLGLTGFFISRYMSAYQMGHIDFVWDPFFPDGTRTVITSPESKAWPVPDSGLGGVTYMLEVLMALMGDARRWRTMPWMVLAFGIVVVPLGVVSIVFIIIQPIMIGTWCTLCLVAALLMLIMIPYTLDELIAMGQFMLYVHRRRLPFWRNFFKGGAMDGSRESGTAEFEGPLGAQARRLARGVNWPWTLVASALIGVALMFTRVLFGSEPPMADSDHLVGALVITVSIIALAEVARPLRFINTLFGLWLIAAPWLLEGHTQLAAWASIAAGVALIGLSLPKGPVRERYAGWNRYIV
jgi:uncharacterized membrane protein